MPRPPLVAVAAVLAACVQTNATQLGAARAARPKVHPDSVAVYRVASSVPGRYEEIALLNAAGPSGMTNEAGMVKSMRKKAGDLGANAVILDAISEPSAGAKVAAAVVGVQAQRKGSAVAIFVFPDPSK